MIILVVLLVMSVVSAYKVLDTDLGYADQEYYPGVVKVFWEDGSTSALFDECTEDGEEIDYQGWGTYESSKTFTVLREYSSESSSSAESFYMSSEDGEEEVLLYYTEYNCQECVYVDGAPDYCLASEDRAEDGSESGADSDGGFIPQVPGDYWYDGVVNTYIAYDRCLEDDPSVLSEVCKRGDCGNHDVEKVKYSVFRGTKNCLNGCVHVTYASGYCAPEGLGEFGCESNSECASGYVCMGGRCSSESTQSSSTLRACNPFGCDTNNNDYVDEEGSSEGSCVGVYFAEEITYDEDCASGTEEDLQYKCEVYGCDCDGDGLLETAYSSGSNSEKVGSALASALCVASPGTQVAGYDAWCDSESGTWYATDSRYSDTGECVEGTETAVAKGSRSRSLQRSAEFANKWWNPFSWF